MRTIRWFLTLYVTVIAMGALDEAGMAREGVLLFLLVILLQWPLIVLHELGHLVAAKTVGARVSQFVILPFGFDFERRKFFTEGRSKGTDLGGYVRLAAASKLTRRSKAIVLAGGVTFELIAGLVFLGIVWLLHRSGNGFYGSSRVVVGFLNSAAVLALGSVVLNLLPIGGSDGNQLLKLIRSSLKTA